MPSRRPKGKSGAGGAAAPPSRSAPPPRTAAPGTIRAAAVAERQLKAHIQSDSVTPQAVAVAASALAMLGDAARARLGFFKGFFVQFKTN